MISKGFFQAVPCVRKVFTFWTLLDIMSQNGKLSILGREKLEQAILELLETRTPAELEQEISKEMPPFREQRQRTRRILAELEQDQAGKWSFRPS